MKKAAPVNVSLQATSARCMRALDSRQGALLYFDNLPYTCIYCLPVRIASNICLYVDFCCFVAVAVVVVVGICCPVVNY